MWRLRNKHRTNDLANTYCCLGESSLEANEGGEETPCDVAEPGTSNEPCEVAVLLMNRPALHLRKSGGVSAGMPLSSTWQPAALIAGKSCKPLTWSTHCQFIHRDGCRCQALIEMAPPAARSARKAKLPGWPSSVST